MCGISTTKVKIIVSIEGSKNLLCSKRLAYEIGFDHAVTLHTTLLCSAIVVDITLTKVSFCKYYISHSGTIKYYDSFISHVLYDITNV
jgi:hypothetical protein